MQTLYLDKPKRSWESDLGTHTMRGPQDPETLLPIFCPPFRFLANLISSIPRRICHPPSDPRPRSRPDLSTSSLITFLLPLRLLAVPGTQKHGNPGFADPQHAPATVTSHVVPLKRECTGGVVVCSVPVGQRTSGREG